MYFIVCDLFMYVIYDRKNVFILFFALFLEVVVFFSEYYLSIVMSNK